MAKSVRMADIAEVMGVSTVTVSKALSGQKGVSEELRAKIRDKAEAMGYRTASALNQERARRSVSYTIGAIVADRFLDKYESFYWKLYQEVATVAVQKGCFTMLEVLQSEDEKYMIMPKLLQEKKTEGLVIIGRLRKEYLDKLMEYADVPVFFLDFYGRNGQCDSIVSNGYFGMYTMTNFLFDMGHRDIAFMGNVLATDSITDRYFGYVKSLYEHGIDVDKAWVINDRDPQTGRSDDGFTIKLPEKMPTAFVCNNDAAAAMLVQTLERNGYKVPEDISVVGYDNYQPPGLCDIGITSYEVDMHEMAERTVKNMISKISGVYYKQGVYIVNGRIIYKDSVLRRQPED
ncbi:MAG: LacI family DNA-binding transcriptional regulator [Lachnospiraceae bacterium]|nr:LacI family DNA-binding transcriptional regulator [Lachnospiraceae bacterium]